MSSTGSHLVESTTLNISNSRRWTRILLKLVRCLICSWDNASFGPASRFRDESEGNVEGIRFKKDYLVARDLSTEPLVERRVKS